MTRSNLRRLESADPDRIVAELSTRQFLTPHHPLGQILFEAQHDLGFCPQAAQTAIDWLRLEPSVPIGRLRRTELIQLAQSIHRFRRQTAGQEAACPQPA